MRYVKMNASRCAADIGDGSERGEYVPQEYVFKALERPSRAINLMYEYHPDDEKWPEMGTLENKIYKRARRTNKYFPYMAIDEGHTNCEPFKCMRDIRKYGQDIILTMTFDLEVPREHLVQIAKDLRSFGDVTFRINHECNGSWWTFNKEHSYKEVSDFFIKFHNIIKEYAPNVKTNTCFNAVDDNTGIYARMREDELAPAFRIADIVSYDCYHSLHWGWPDDGYDPVKYGVDAKIKKMEKMGQVSNDEWWRKFNDFYELMLKVNNGKEKDIYLGEANTDANVVGLKGQAEWIKEFYNEVKERNLSYFKGITYYQFRDRGGLGLEYELDEDKHKGRPNPSLEAYRDVIKDPYFSPDFEEEQGEVKNPVLEWRLSRDAKGIFISGSVPKGAEKCLIKFQPDMNVIVKVNEKWFHKGLNVDTLDISSALGQGSPLKIYVFAPPPNGENTPDPENPDYLDVYKCRIKMPPEIVFPK
ncbi:MAG: hypothetical protein U9Q21_00785 [Candidatus Auribacterota bacterium]|nr:hypothetical protein [Candidatus Auribacterota bacterium]